MRTPDEIRKAMRDILQKQNDMIAEVGGRDEGSLGDEEFKLFNTLQQDFDVANRELVVAESMEANAKATTGKPAWPVTLDVQKSVLDKGGFSSAGEFLAAVRFGDPKGRLKSYATTAPIKNEVPGTEKLDDSAFMMPDGLYQEIMTLPLEDEIVRPRATVIAAGGQPDAGITIPSLNQSGSAGLLGGVKCEWIKEGDLKPLQNADLTTISLLPKELAASMLITDKMLRNVPAVGTLYTRLLMSALAQVADIAYLCGKGATATPPQPTGILSSAAQLYVSRAAAGRISYEDIIAMEQHILPSVRARAVWIADISRYTQVQLMTDPAGQYIFTSGNATTGAPDLLRGRPIFWTDKLATSGATPTKGDFGLFALSHYVIKEGFGPIVQATPYPYFQNNTTLIKAFNNTDGKPWLTAPLTMRNGMKASPFVALDSTVGPSGVPGFQIVAALPTTGQVTGVVYVLSAAAGGKPAGSMWNWGGTDWVAFVG